MARKRKDKRGRQPQRRAVRSAPPPREDGILDADALESLRVAWRSDDPYDLLMVASSAVGYADPRLLRALPPDDDRPSLAAVVDAFTATSYAETTAALHLLRVLVTDEALVSTIDRELMRRRQPMPAWLSQLGQARIEPEVVVVTNDVEDGADYTFGATLPSGLAVTAGVYVDHNLGGIAKNAFVTTSALSVLLDAMHDLDDADLAWSTVDPATARAALEQAIALGARTHPPPVSLYWPRCRPLVEWLLRLMPAGGAVPERPGWSPGQVAKLADDFFASADGALLDDHDHRELLAGVLAYGTDQGNRDPLRWSGSAVEILLLDWFPRKVVGQPRLLTKLPELLRGFIPYAHQRSGIRRATTMDTLAALEAFAPDYRLLISSSRPQGPAALLATPSEEAVGPARDRVEAYEVDLFGETPAGLTRERALERLAAAVGGDDHLQKLDDRPLPDEPFGWDGVAEDIRPAVAETLTIVDRCADDLLDVEHRTAMRRLLHRAAVGDPDLFRRGSSTVRGAATIAWVIGKANDTIGTGRRAEVKDLLSWFGIGGSVSQRAEPLLRAVGAESTGFAYAPDVGTPDLLVASRRARLMERRDRLQG